MKTNTLDFDAQALREKILDLAMRGKLVPQDSNDKPASVLLKKIKAEKEQLIKEKKIKKSKSLAPITDDEKPFDIPDSWEWVRFGDVGLLKNGKTPKKEDISSDNIYPYFKVKDMNNNNLYMENAKNWVGEKYSRQVMPKNTIIFPKNGGAILTAKKRILTQDSLVDLNTGGLIPYNDLNHKFIFYLFLSLDIKDFVKGSAVPTINSKKLKETLVPLPPLEEQSRIAAKIAQLFALLRKVESSTQQYAKLQTLMKSKVLDLAMRGKLVEQDPHDEPASVLLERIKTEKEQLVKKGKIRKSKSLPPITEDEKLFNLPQGWTWVKLNDVLALENGAIRRGPFGSSLKKSFFVPKSEDTYKVYEQGNAINHTINYGSYYISYQKYEELQSFSIRPGDIIISGAGTIGKTYILPSNSPKGVINQALIRVRLNEQLISKEYFLFAFKQKVGLINKQAKGTAIKNMFSVTHMKNDLVWALPPLAEQKRITKKIQNILSFVK